jgi:hypothetical protein
MKGGGVEKAKQIVDIVGIFRCPPPLPERDLVVCSGQLRSNR